MAQTGLRIGEVAERAGVSIDAVRYYERRRLLPRAPRTGGGFRVFTSEAVERVRFIKQAQELGFSLDEISELLINEGGAGKCRSVQKLLRTKLDEMDARMKAIKNFRRTLARYLDECEGELEQRGEAAQCPVLIGISHADERKMKD
jgi:MerR family mercuric resistance operon transcriptional regulator